VGFGEDLFDGFDPDERMAAVVPAVDEGADAAVQVAMTVDEKSRMWSVFPCSP
jgi:hypothetical protein